MVEKNDLMGGIVTDVVFDRFQLVRVSISTPNGRKYDILCDDDELVCPRVV